MPQQAVHVHTNRAPRPGPVYSGAMATWEDVRSLAMALPEAAEETSRETARWTVRGKLFVWERPLRKADLEALGDAAPDGPILGARVADEGV